MKTIFAMLFFMFLSVSVFAQNSYKKQLSRLQTRWAKEVSPDNALKEYPRPQLVRKQWQNLNGLWHYAITQKDSLPPTNYDNVILVPYPLESALSGVRKTLYPNQNLWYNRTIIKPLIKSSERIVLHFGAVDWQATVYLNGNKIGQHTGGYTEFSFDITEELKTGNNELSVKVYDPSDQGIGPHGKQVLNPQNIYYTASSGIWQTVWLEVVPQNYINSLTMTPDIDKGILNLRVNATTKAPVTITYNGKAIKGYSNTQLILPVKDARLWSPDDPYLYDLTIKLDKDEVKSYFGMRKIAIQKDKKGIDRIFLNNKYTYNLGTLDQGFWPDGLYTAPTDDALKFDIAAIKSMGFNTIRKHIKVEPARWYYHADKIGMLVWQDMVNPNQGLPEGSKQAFEQQCQETLEQLHNYPSIITWVLFNENWGQYDQKQLTNWMKVTDPSRLIDGHSGELLYVNGKLKQPSKNPYINADMTDVHSYPDPMLPEKQPNKIWVCGEFGGVGVSVPGHQWDDLSGWGYIKATAIELDNKYDVFVQQLKKLESEGLSGSIYTQPFDVEGEENGLITYDREIIKIPFQKLRNINSQLINLKDRKINESMPIAMELDKNDNDSRYAEFQEEFEKGKSDSSFLRRLMLMALRKHDQSGATKYGNAYISNLKNVYNHENLTFIDKTTGTSLDAGFNLFLKHMHQINAVLGANTAERKIREIAGREELEPYLRTENTEAEWETVRQKIVSKFGPLGEEKYNGARMILALEKQDWKNFGKFYASYFQTALERSDFHINNVSWTLFEHVDDPKVLDIAIKANEYNIKVFMPNEAVEMDTYANLLYKAGRRDEAIAREQEAVKLSNNGREFVETLNKMKAGQKTWPEK